MDEVNQRLSDLRRETRERYLEFMKIDVDALREIEASTEDHYEEIAGMLTPMIKEMGKDAVKRHQYSVERFNTLNAKAKELTQYGTVDPSLLRRAFCFCFPYSTIASVNQNCEPWKNPLDTEETENIRVKAECNHDTTKKVFQPYLKVNGSTSGELNEGKVRIWYTYTFKPYTDGIYCISPDIFLNGHWLAWTWGSCDTSTPLGIADVKVSCKVRIDQLSTTIKTHEYEVLNIHKDGQSGQSGFSYASLLDGGSHTKVYLEGGFDAVIFVEVEAFASVLNPGIAIIDMKTSPVFGCKSEELWYAKQFCIPWPLHALGYLEALTL